jgi:hypothetical protein
MPILSTTWGYLFLMAPGTGCTAVGEGVLIPYLEGEYFPAEHVRDHTGKMVLDKKHATLAQLKRQGLLTAEETTRLFKFTTIRNPFDVLVTRYFRLRTMRGKKLSNHDSFVHPRTIESVRLAMEQPFAVWVELNFRMQGRRRLRHPLSRYRAPRHYHEKHIRGADFLMRFERLQEDFNEVLRCIGVDKPIEIPRINVTNDREGDYREYYTPRARAIVERVFAPDLARFGYSF